MKIALVEKIKTSATEYSAFDFEFDMYALISKKKKRVLKADIELNIDWLKEEYDYIILVGSEPAKFIGKITNVTKLAGELVDNKYLPLLNPFAVKFRPELQTNFDNAIKNINAHIKGEHLQIDGDYIGINDTKEAIKYLTEALNYDVIAADTETVGFYPRDGYVLGISLSWKEKFGIYISSECIDSECENLLKKVFAEKHIIFHNSKFDMSMLEYNFGVKFNSWDDTQLMHYLLNENEPHDLKYIAIKYLKMGDYDAELELFKRDFCKRNKIKLSEFTYDFIPFETIAPYAAADADATIRAYNLFNPYIKKGKQINNVYKTIIKPGLSLLKDVENTGVPFSKTKLKVAQVEYDKKIYEIKKELDKYKEIRKVEAIIGTTFNPNSTDHLSKLFFDVLNLPIIKRTPEGKPSTDKEVLTELMPKHDIVKKISELRQLVKIKSTYIDKVLVGLDSDQRLRTGFHLHTVVAGRLSSSGKLNMQQLPRDDKTVKSCIVPIVGGQLQDDWYVFSQDLQTAEMYYAAVESKDKALMNVFRLGQDFHSTIAHQIFKLPGDIKDVKEKFSKERQAAKAISFGILYGAGAKKVAEQANISLSEAQEAIDLYFGTFKQLANWINITKAQINRDGYTYSYFGRKRRVPSVFSIGSEERGHAERSALNFRIQSVASDVNLLIAIDTNTWVKENNIKAEIFALVHDSILGLVHKDSKDLLEKRMGELTALDRGVNIPGCPIRRDFLFGASYAEAT